MPHHVTVFCAVSSPKGQIVILHAAALVLVLPLRSIKGIRGLSCANLDTRTVRMLWLQNDKRLFVYQHSILIWKTTFYINNVCEMWILVIKYSSDDYKNPPPPQNKTGNVLLNENNDRSRLRFGYDSMRACGPLGWGGTWGRLSKFWP
jgi:hypothetical protein